MPMHVHSCVYTSRYMTSFEYSLPYQYWYTHIYQQVYIYVCVDIHTWIHIFTVTYILFLGSYLLTYYVQVEVQNNHHNPVIIKYREGGVLGVFQKLYVKSAYHTWFDVAFIKSGNRPITAEFMAFDAFSDALLYASSKISIIYRPQYQNGTLILSIGEAGMRFEVCLEKYFLYFY